MRSLEFEIKDLGKYRIESEPYDIYEEQSKKMSSKKSYVLSKLKPIGHNGVLASGILDNEKYFFLRRFIDYIYDFYHCVNVFPVDDMEEYVEKLNKDNNENIYSFVFSKISEETP